jgi:hypothetical protein
VSGTIPARDAANGVREVLDVITDVGEPHDDEQLTRGHAVRRDHLCSHCGSVSPQTAYFPVFDEWVMIDRATSGSWLREMFIGFNGHL